MSQEEEIAFQPRFCCACGEIKTTVRNIAFINQKAPVPGTGWSCVVCHLPPDGAIAMVCDDCNADPEVQLKWAIAGGVNSEGRVPIEELAGTHGHDPRFHPEFLLEMN
jgi:hypothetical protein